MQSYFRPVLYKASAVGTKTFILPGPVKQVTVQQPFKMTTQEIPLVNGSYNYGNRRQAKIITVSGGTDLEGSCSDDELDRYTRLTDLDAFLDLTGGITDRFEFFDIYDDETPLYRKYGSCSIKDFTYTYTDELNNLFSYTLVLEAEWPYLRTTAPGVA